MTTREITQQHLIIKLEIDNAIRNKIYIYIYRERERERELFSLDPQDIEKEREKERSRILTILGFTYLRIFNHLSSSPFGGVIFGLILQPFAFTNIQEKRIILCS